MTDRWHREDPTDPYSKWISGYMPAARVAGVADNRSGNSGHCTMQVICV